MPFLLSLAHMGNDVASALISLGVPNKACYCQKYTLTHSLRTSSIHYSFFYSGEPQNYAFLRQWQKVGI